MTVLDPLVYEAAIKHWKHGHYRIAVGEAATNVDRFTQRRLQRFDVSGAPLWGRHSARPRLSPASRDCAALATKLTILLDLSRLVL